MDTQRAQTLPELFMAATTKYVKNTACLYRPRFRTIIWTYQELWNHAVLFSQVLEKEGVEKGDRVVIMSQNSPFWVAAFFGIQLRGAIAVPLSPESNQKLVEEICRQTTPKVIFRGSIAALQQVPGYTILQLEEIEKPKPLGVSGLEVKVSEKDLAEIVYTSGTTGFPKGVMLTHKNLLSNLTAVKKVIRTDQSFKFLSILPLFHMFEQTGGMLIPISVGAQISYSASLNPNHLKRIAQDDKPNIMLAVPEFLRLIYLRLLEKAKEEGKLTTLDKLLKVSEYIPLWASRKLFGKIHRTFGWKLHTFVSGGAPLEKEVGEFWEGIGIYILQGYGLTETSPVLTVNGYADRKINSLGKPIENVEIKIANDGEVLAKGPNVFSGYWQAEEKTKESFTNDGWFKTGDIGYFDEDGHLFLKGRKKHMIVLPTGEKVHPEDVEKELNKEPGVLDSTVLGVAETSSHLPSSSTSFRSAIAQGGEVRVHAVLLMKEPSEKVAREIVGRVNERLLPHQQIKDVSLWPYEDFPRTPTKKVKKHEVLEEIKKAEKEKEPVLSVSASKLESIIALILGIPAEKIQDSQLLVKDLGLDSLGRIELVARIETHINVSVDESEITEKTTVGDIKETILARKHKKVKYEFNPKLFSLRARVLRAIFQPLLLLPLIWIFAPIKLRGIEKVKKSEKPALFYSNHLSAVDGAIVFAALPGKIRRRLSVATATDVVYTNKSFWWKLLRFILERFYLSLPFEREGQVKTSFEHIARALDRGYSVLLFPEGRISPDGNLQELKKGAALLAKEMQVFIIPVKLGGTRSIIDVSKRKGGESFQFPKRAPVLISFGDSFRLSQDVSDEAALKEIEQKMKDL